MGEPVINEDFAAMAEFYDLAVFPARARHPKDKALVENAVKLMYRTVYADIEGLVFHDLASLNEAVHKSLTAFNDRRMSGRIESRRGLFEEVEKEYLQPLPAVRFQMKDLGEIYERAGAIDKGGVRDVDNIVEGTSVCRWPSVHAGASCRQPGHFCSSSKNISVSCGMNRHEGSSSEIFLIQAQKSCSCPVSRSKNR